MSSRATTFTFAFAGGFLTVPAGPADQGGYCTVDGLYPVGTVLTVAESVPAGREVSALTVNPSNRLVGMPDFGGETVNVTVGSSINEVTFTNRASTGGTTTTPKASTTTTVKPTTTTMYPTTT